MCICIVFVACVYCVSGHVYCVGMHMHIYLCCVCCMWEYVLCHFHVGVVYCVRGCVRVPCVHTTSEAKSTSLSLLQTSFSRGFTKNMKLEAVNPRNPRELCVASVVGVKGRLLWLHLEGGSGVLGQHFWRAPRSL